MPRTDLPIVAIVAIVPLALEPTNQSLATMRRTKKPIHFQVH
jgi:hypothetical protein